MAYASVEELAYVLRVTPTDTTRPVLQACIDAAATEIDHAIDGPMIDPPDALVNRVNVLRGVEWWKANDAVAGLGFEQIGTLQVPRGSFTRHAATLVPVKAGWGVA